MSRTLRNIAIAVGVLIVILIIVPFLIPVNRFRPTIEEKASAALGRKVQVGDLSLSLLGGALTAKDLSIGDDPKFSPSPFLTAKSLSVGVEMMPLIFSKELNVTGIAIDEPRSPSRGRWSWSWLRPSCGSSSGTDDRHRRRRRFRLALPRGGRSRSWPVRPPRGPSRSMCRLPAKPRVG